MSIPKHVLMTGHRGYIGSVMAPSFVRAGHRVTGLDTNYYAPCTLVPDLTPIPSIDKDIRDLESSDLRGFDAVVHLAALSNDPIGNLNSDWTDEINYKGSVRLAELARSAGVERFLLSSSCIMYGMSEVAEVNEESPQNTKTEYARSKVKSEQHIGTMARDGFSPTFMRNGTVYGVSPRMRFDTVFNDLMGSAVSTGKVIVYSDGKPWRPVVHIEDVARAFLRALDAPLADVHNQAFNVGTNSLNHQVIELAQLAAETVPGCILEVLARPGADQRTYKTDFSKFARTFPDFEFQWTIQKAAKAMLRTFTEIGLTQGTLIDKRFTRLKWLKHLIETGRLDGSLRWVNGRVEG